MLPAGAPVALAAAELPAAARASDQPVFWAGPTPGDRVEVTRSGPGATAVRYLPAGAPAGDPRPAHLTVATYRVPDASARARAAAARPGMRSRPVAGGAVAVWNPRAPANVFLVPPRPGLLVEVFSPVPEQARHLALSGALAPAGR